LPRCAESRTQPSAIFGRAELTNTPITEPGMPTYERSGKRPRITGIQWLKIPTHPPSGRQSGKQSPNHQHYARLSMGPQASKTKHKYCDKLSSQTMTHPHSTNPRIASKVSTQSPKKRFSRRWRPSHPTRPQETTLSHPQYGSNFTKTDPTY